MNLSGLDWLIISFYIAFLLFFGFYKSYKNKNEKSPEQFILAGRTLTLPIFIATLVATWYGNILGVGEFVYNNGLVAWLCFGITYYVAAFLFAIFAAKKIRPSLVTTIPEQIAGKFGNKAGLISSFAILVITIPAAYFLMLGVMINIFTGLRLEFCIVLGVAVAISYLFMGGFKSDIRTNSLNFILMYFGFFTLLFFSILKYGYPLQIINKLPSNHLSMTGGMSWQIIAVWFIIALQTFVDPSFHQRCAAAKSGKIARNGILISIILWFVFDMLTLTCGLYARANFQGIQPMLSYPVLSDAVLPSIWKGLFVVSLLATILSSLDSYSFISAITIGYDIFPKLFKVRAVNSVAMVRLGLLITGIIGIIMAIILPSAIQLIYKTASIVVPGLLAILIISYTKKYTLESAKAAMIIVVSFGFSFIWLILNLESFNFYYPLKEALHNIEPMFPGFLISIILTLLFIKKAVPND